MTTKFLHFDAFGIYAPGGPVDQIIDAFDEAKVTYRHHHLTAGIFEMGYLATPRAEKIIARVAERHYAERAWRFQKDQLKLLDEHYPEEAFEHLRAKVTESFPLFRSFSISTQDCTQCGDPCPAILVVEGRCPDCKELS